MSKFTEFSSLAVIYFLVVVSTIVAATDVHYCDTNREYEVKVHGVDIFPYPIARGEPATFSISANTDAAISSGKLVIEVSYFGWHIHSETHDLCDETSCPVAIGDFVVEHSQVLPGYTPPRLSDNLADTISYVDIFSIAKDIVEGSPRNLVEAVAELIASKTLEKFPQINAVLWKLSKPNVALIKTTIGYLGVE